MSLPVFSAVEVPEELFKVEGEVMGTAFALGGEYMLTAGHVVTALASTPQRCGVVGLVSPDGSGIKAAKITEHELLNSDLALLRVEFVVPGSQDWFHRFKWREEALNPFEPVRTVGYGYGLQTIDDTKKVIVRGFTGHVVAALDAFKPPGWSGAAFPVYELSFTAPRGLSGAPLLNGSGKVAVLGVIIGNSESKMVVFRSEEHTNEVGATTSFEQYEALTLGIAVQAGEVLRQSSRLLSSTLGEHLKAHGLLW